jgi:hypothetical protein
MNDDPPRVSRYRVSPAIDRVIHLDSAQARRFRALVVEAMRDVTTDVYNRMIEETRADQSPDNALSSEGYYAGLIEGMVEAVYHDLATALASGVPPAELADVADEISRATDEALAELTNDLRAMV